MMLSHRFAILLFAALSLAFGLALPTPAQAEAKPPAKAPPKPKKPKKPKKPADQRSQAHKPPVHHHPRTAAQKAAQRHYVGRAYHSRTWWYWHHHRHHWVYEVRYRSRAWSQRAFATRPAAVTFMHHLRHHHFERRLGYINGAWLVSYRNPHHHHYATYAVHAVAVRVELSLRQLGFSAWLRWHRRYF